VNPADAIMRMRFLASLWLRARVLPLRIGQRPLEKVLELANYSGPDIYRGLSADYICHRVRRSTRRPWFMRDRRCLREGVLGFYYLRAAGFKPELRFAIDPKSVGQSQIMAHCWVCLDDTAILSEKGQFMVDLFVYPSASKSKERSELQ
jgi:hypothetical protein